MCVSQFGEWPNLNKTPNSLTFYLEAFKSQTKNVERCKIEGEQRMVTFLSIIAAP